MPKHWSITPIWDAAFSKQREPIKSREYVYASEVGSSFVDVYYKMKGVPASNAPTKVAKMKMEAGNVWESIVRFVLKRAGLLKVVQQKVDFSLPGLLPVHGKLDMVSGGRIDLKQAEKASKLVKAYFLELFGEDSLYVKIADNVLQMVHEMSENHKFADLYEYVNEIKSISAFVWTLVESTGKPAAYHASQVFHYTYGLELLHGVKREVGRVTYINRDDCRIMEMNVYNNNESLLKYQEWLYLMTEFVGNQVEPPREQKIIFNEVSGRFYKNTMGVEWSPYLTMLYGYGSTNEFREEITPKVGRFNAVFKRCLEAKNMTAKNIEVIKDAKTYFPNWDNMVDQAKLKGLVPVEETEEIDS